MQKADGSIVIKTSIDISKAEKDLSKLRGGIEDTERDIEKTRRKRAEANKNASIFGEQLDAENAKLKEMESRLKEIRAIAKDSSLSPSARSETQAKIPTLEADIADQRERVRLLKVDYNKAASAVERYDARLKEAGEKLDEQVEEAGALAKQINVVSRASGKMSEAHQRAAKSMNRFRLRLKEVVRSALVFTLISRGAAQFREWMGKVIKINEAARQSIAKLKGALLMFAQPLVNVIIPGVTKLADILTQVLIVGARLFAAVSGQTLEQAKDSAEALEKESEALEELGTAADGAKKSLASFDEINQLTGEMTESINLEVIEPDFEFKSELPEWIDSLLTGLEIKIQELTFSLKSGNITKDMDAWSVFLSGILGAIIGGSFGGITGSAIGLLLGVTVGLVSLEFLDKLEGVGEAEESFFVVLTSMLGLILGSLFGGVTGGVIGLMLGATVGFVSLTFFDELENADEAKKIFYAVMGAILSAVLGAQFGGLTGAVIGLLLGASISIVSLAFEKGKLEGWGKDDTLIVALSAILGAILGGVFGGISGAVIGLLLGASISFVSLTFGKGLDAEVKQEAIASLRIAIFAILGAVFGSMFGGFAGGVIGVMFGLTVGFATVAFDPEMGASVRSAAQKSLTVAMTSLIGALIGAVFGGGVFGGIVGGVIGLTFGVYINFVVEGFGDLKEKVPNFTGIGPDYSWLFKSTTAQGLSVPGLATGSVVPPNREFLAVLGDNKTEHEVVSPLSTIEQAVQNVLSRNNLNKTGETTIVLELDKRELGRAIYSLGSEESRHRGTTLVVK